jgi:hypothetical protein
MVERGRGEGSSVEVWRVKVISEGSNVEGDR